jgi:hypothetical protein
MHASTNYNLEWTLLDVIVTDSSVHKQTNQDSSRQGKLDQ